MRHLLSFALLPCMISVAAAQSNSTSTAKSQKGTPAQAAVAGSDSRWAPGWVIDVMPQPLKDQGTEVAGRFVAKPEGFAFGDFRKTVPLPGWVSFQAHGTFDAKHDEPKIQRYAFTLIISSPSELNFGFSTYCQENITIDGKEIVQLEGTKRRFDGRGKFETSVSGGADLDQSSHEISFSVKCEYNTGYDQIDSDRVFHIQPGIKEVFEKTRVDFKVLTPNDLAPRAPASNELVHLVKIPRR